MKKELLLGNEAIVQGAMEAGVAYTATFPGTPASEVGDLFAKFSKKNNFYSEYCTNEKIAMESAAGAAFAGLKSIVSMKHYGLNVACDSLFPLVYLECPLVVFVCDDPGCWSSVQAEQDTRWASRQGKIPTLEPSNSQEAKDMTIYAFELAEKQKIPILIRSTTRIAYTRTEVDIKDFKKPKTEGKFIKKPFKLSSANTVDLHNKTLEKIEKIKQISESSKFNFEDKGEGDLGIITSGISYQYVKKACKDLEINPPILKLGLTYPAPSKTIEKFAKRFEKILVVEEQDPILEEEVRMTCHQKVHGKDLIPEAGELEPGLIIIALSKLLNKEIPKELTENIKPTPPRLPTFCAGCPHRSTFYAIKEIIGDEVIYGSDIGCYMLGAYPPYNMMDYAICMGGGLGLSHGISKATKEKPVVFIGESTFLHAGIPSLINAVYNKSDLLLVILDNSYTAMTGQQPNPGTGITGMGDETKEINFEEIAKACKVDYVKTTNAFNQAILKKDIKEAYNKKGVCVLISQGECRLNYIRKMARTGKNVPKFTITKQDPQLEVLKDFACPAIQKEDGKWKIYKSLCWGCSVCKQLAPEQIEMIKDE